MMWLNQNFLLANEVQLQGAFKLEFICLRSHQDLVIDVASNGTTTIKTVDMDLAGDVVQSLCNFLNISDMEVEYYTTKNIYCFAQYASALKCKTTIFLQAEADFPEDIAQLDMLIRSVDEYQESNDRLGADIADQSGVVKSMLIRAEDARLIGNM